MFEFHGKILNNIFLMYFSKNGVPRTLYLLPATAKRIILLMRNKVQKFIFCLELQIVLQKSTFLMFHDDHEYNQGTFE